MRWSRSALVVLALVAQVTLGFADDKKQPKQPAPKEQPKEMTKDLLDTCWNDLRGDNAELAWERIVLLRSFPKQSIPFLIEKIQPATPPDMTKIQGLITQLDDNAFAQRQDAEKELEKYGSLAEKPLREHLDKKLGSVELRRSIERILEKIDSKTLPPDDLRIVRAFEVLEFADSDESIAHIQVLAKGADGACVTREARETLERLKLRGKVK